ncbi:hypothetical protein CAPTEDRAFT_220852 [Capitella teleta]|uniref:DDE-1 domain-containing protein n=1 Tax=Capitella teleta TaxID=283909 RepID=R7V930_CAPTE|nr:hypothetical protein CAPTEDRAFT_220852 [Capitella teleta]|eukprot:ELU15353.1 hypothetical protein CAPTEDRAFT_220852 [Capitella teleta]
MDEKSLSTVQDGQSKVIGAKARKQNLKAIIRAKEAGVVMVSLPPHCTYKLQPLGASKFIIATLFSSWETCDNLADCQVVSTLRIAKHHQEATGLFPLNKDKFGDLATSVQHSRQTIGLIRLMEVLVFMMGCWKCPPSPHCSTEAQETSGKEKGRRPSSKGMELTSELQIQEKFKEEPKKMAKEKAPKCRKS